MRHIAVIPARMGSQGLPFKNRMFFDQTADFIDKINWFDAVITSTDDPVLIKNSRERGYQVRERPESLSGPAVPIKEVFNDLVGELEFSPNEVLWLFYIPLLYREKAHFEEARVQIENQNVNSLCTFVKAKTHPYNCWQYDNTLKNLSQYIPNDNFRRQDLPLAWMHYHYICCFKVDELSSLNSELLNTKTVPFFLDAKTTKNLVEVDTPEDLDLWKTLQSKPKKI